jgi:hypothetical protein
MLVETSPGCQSTAGPQPANSKIGGSDHSGALAFSPFPFAQSRADGPSSRTLASLFVAALEFLPLTIRKPQIWAFTPVIPNRDAPLLDGTLELTENWLGFGNKRLPNGNSGCLELFTQSQLRDGDFESAQMREGQSRNKLGPGA